MAKLFISYRREDSAHQADRLYEQLSKHVEDPRRDIFLDVDSIPFGVDFVTYLDGKVAECEVLLALIGKGWLAASDPKTGGRRLDDPKDFVRIEIASALKRGIPVVPVLLDGVPVPGAGDLPDDLKPLARRNGIVVTRRSFEGDVTALVRGLPTQLTARSGKDSEGRTALLVVGALLAAGLMAFAVHLILGIESKPGGVDQVFSDALFGGGQGPEMVVIPAGSFSMGSSPDERGRGADESPQHTVRIGSAFAVGKYEVTWAEWQACVDDGGCSNSGPDSRGGDEGWGKGSRPVINVSWENAQDYVSWLSRETGETYRLLTEAEWEYTLRRGTTGQFNY
ncbi:MAG: SUMF1/EgtB/PvdO family nonheme iron enzyme, partial [Hyphomonadaceae bacterium]|nr:SUMF1/EgtB/PvdO family nonheme iron enzyme [Hyphomonadaceae bacterium]